MNRIWIGISCLLALAVGTACGDDDGVRPTPDAGPTDDAGRRDSGPRPDTGPRPDAGPGGDGNDSFAEAEDLAFGAMMGSPGAIDEPEDHDFFQFDGTAGQWVSISTEANPDDDPEMIDTVITLYDSSMTRIAENDDAVPRVSTDSEIITRLPADGTYYVEVQEFSDWYDDPMLPAEGDPSFEYTLILFEISGDAPAVTLDAEGGDDLASAQALKFSMDFGLLIGTFEDDTDVDVFSFSVAMTTGLLSIDLMPDSDLGYGSTTPAGRVWVTDSTGSTIIARVDQSAGYQSISPSLPMGDYLLWVSHPGGGAGTNDFYVAKVIQGMENPPEVTPDDNDTIATADTISQTMVEGTMQRSGFLLTHLSSPTDVDYYSFTVMGTEQVTLVCGSGSEGAGVTGLLAEIVDASDTVIAMETEMPPDGIALEDVMVSAEGTYYLKLTKTGQDAEVTGDFVRCGVHVAPPAAP